MTWYWIALIVYVSVCVIISILEVFLKPLGYVDKVLWTAWKYIIEFVYIVLVWLWLAIIRNKPTPRIWLFKKAF